eukprot:14530764-Alexandrium_andersonii.AAC.1
MCIRDRYSFQARTGIRDLGAQLAVGSSIINGVSKRRCEQAAARAVSLCAVKAPIKLAALEIRSKLAPKALYARATGVVPRRSAQHLQ